MKKLFTIIICSLCFTFLSVHADIFGSDFTSPKKGFKTLAELNAWAGKHEWTGGYAGKLTLEGKSVFYSIRSFTSGRASGELVLYSLNSANEIHPFLIIPTQLKDFRVEVNKEDLIITQYDTSVNKRIEILRLNKHALPLDSK